jgi:hypothetical protein
MFGCTQNAVQLAERLKSHLTRDFSSSSAVSHAECPQNRNDCDSALFVIAIADLLCRWALADKSRDATLLLIMYRYFVTLTTDTG